MSDALIEAVLLSRPATTPSSASAFGVTLKTGCRAADYGRWRGPVSEVIDGITGRLAADGLERLTARVWSLENTVVKLMAALEPGIIERITAEVDVAMEELEPRVQALTAIQTETTSLLHRSVTHAERTTAEAIAETQALREELRAALVQIEAALAALPATWRHDIHATLDELRNSPDAANALLHGAETLAASLARSLDDFKTGELQ
ncbi:MAG: hypothetical protein ACOYM8_11100 [Caulobacterales bacterium]